MNGDNVAKIITSRAFTILLLTLSAAFFMKKLPDFLRELKKVREED